MSGINGHDPATTDRFTVEDDDVRWPYSQVGDWVTLAPISDRAFRVYGILRAHINQTRADEEAWPSQTTVANVMGLSKGDEVGKAIKELIAIGAVSARVVNGKDGRYTKYVVRREPPNDAWAGPRRSSDLYKPGVMDEIREERVAKRPYQVGKRIKSHV